jgi:NDP-sugar pyrophosphorylase family protein
MSLPTLVILAGGLATRLRPITETVPKSLIDVAGEPFLAHQLRLAASQGFKRVVVCVGYLGEQVERYIATSESFGLEVVFSYDGDILRGTGGALRNALPKLNDNFFVIYGDSYLNVVVEPIYAAYLASGASALMTVFRNQNRWGASNVAFDGQRVLRHRKAQADVERLDWIDFGLSVFCRQVVETWQEPDPFDLSGLTGALADRGLLAGFAVTQRFYEIGSAGGLATTEDYLRRSGDQSLFASNES